MLHKKFDDVHKKFDDVMTALPGIIGASMRDGFRRQVQTTAGIHREIDNSAFVIGSKSIGSLPICNGARACANCSLLSLAAHCFSHEKLRWQDACKLWRDTHQYLYAPWLSADVFCVIPVMIDRATDSALGLPILEEDLRNCPSVAQNAPTTSHGPHWPDQMSSRLTAQAKFHHTIVTFNDTDLYQADARWIFPHLLGKTSKTLCISTHLVTDALSQFAQSPTCDDDTYLPGALDGKLHVSIGDPSLTAVHSAFLPTLQRTFGVPHDSNVATRSTSLHLLMPPQQFGNGDHVHHISGARRLVDGITYDVHAEGITVSISCFKGSSGAIGYIFREAHSVSTAGQTALCAEQRFVLSAGSDRMPGISVFAALRSPSERRQQAALCTESFLSGASLFWPTNHCDVATRR